MNAKELVQEKTTEVLTITSPLFKTPRSHLMEALSRGFGYNTFAAACADTDTIPGLFDADAFHSRYSVLESERQACTLSAVLKGYTMDLEFTVMGAPGPNALYRVVAAVKGPVLPAVVQFYLPSKIPSRFVNDTGFGDSVEWGHLRHGTWEGRFYGADTQNWGRASLARSIFAALY